LPIKLYRKAVIYGILQLSLDENGRVKAIPKRQEKGKYYCGCFNCIDYGICRISYLLQNRRLEMRTDKELQEMKEWLIKALDEPENQDEKQQIKLYAKLDLLRWLGV
jgi:hypothetical protein